MISRQRATFVTEIFVLFRCVEDQNHTIIRGAWVAIICEGAYPFFSFTHV